GHGVGEIVAACVAGIIMLEDALKLIAQRAQLMQQLPRNGEMASVFADLERVLGALKPHAKDLSLAAINGPAHLVVSRDRQAGQMVLQLLEGEGITTHLLNVSHAFHSPLMNPILEELEKSARQVQYAAPKVKFISSITGQQVRDNTIDAIY